MRKTIRVTYDSKHYLDHWYYESGNKRISLMNLISKNNDLIAIDVNNLLIKEGEIYERK